MRTAVIALAILLIAGTVGAFEINKNLSVDLKGDIIKPFDVTSGTENNTDSLSLSTKHGLWLMDVEAGLKYKIARAFVGYETTTQISRTESAGADVYVIPGLAVRLKYAEQTFYGHDPVVKRYTGIGTHFEF